ncbi:MAG TPA: helix-turn-helix domain-containing protein [Thermoanaerobaculia bacterium]
MILTHGQFFGRFQTEAEAGGFALAHIRADPHRDVQRHTHDAAHFIFVTRGPYVTAAAGAPDVCTAPVLVYNPPGTTHRDRFQRRGDGGFDGKFLSISVAPERWKSIAEAVPLAERAVTVHANALAERLVRELTRWEPSSTLVAEAICLELTACVARMRDEKTPPRWLSVAREMLRDGAPSIGEIAQACGVHPVHLARTFRRFFGCSPGAYLRRARIERAAGMLRSRLSLAEVALRAGFADQSHMTHAFRAHLGVTPAALRGDNQVASVQDEPSEER